VSHWWNRLSHRWNKLCRPWNTGPYSFLSYSYIYNSDCPFTVSFNLDQSQPDKIIHCPDYFEAFQSPPSTARSLHQSAPV
jgi:hypothetical protein